MIRSHTYRRLLLITLVLVLTLGAPVAYAQEGGDPIAATGSDVPPAARVTGLRHEYQTWNNCGPVNITMVLSHYGWQHDQQFAAAWLKPAADDRNVSPSELVAFVAHQTDLPEMRAVWRYGGTLAQIKALVAAGLPVIVESGFQPEGHEWMGHYITVVAYDDAVETIWTYDSYNGYGVGYGEETDYAEFDADWRHFNRTLIVVYPQSSEAQVRAILGGHWQVEYAAAYALATAQAEIAADPRDPWAHFNAGTSYVAVGDYARAAREYDQALAIGLPFRMMWYQFGPYEAYYRTQRYIDMLALADFVEESTTTIEDTNLWRGLALHGLERDDLALEQFEWAVAWNPNHPTAQAWRDALVAGTLDWPGPVRVQAREIP